MTKRQKDAAEFKRLMEDGGFSYSEAGAVLEMTPRMIRNYCAGTHDIPKVVMLAMRHLVHCASEEGSE